MEKFNMTVKQQSPRAVAAKLFKTLSNFYGNGEIKKERTKGKKDGSTNCKLAVDNLIKWFI